MDSSNN